MVWTHVKLHDYCWDVSEHLLPCFMHQQSDRMCLVSHWHERPCTRHTCSMGILRKLPCSFSSCCTAAACSAGTSPMANLRIMPVFSYILQFGPTSLLLHLVYAPTTPEWLHVMIQHIGQITFAFPAHWRGTMSIWHVHAAAGIYSRSQSARQCT